MGPIGVQEGTEYPPLLCGLLEVYEAPEARLREHCGLVVGQTESLGPDLLVQPEEPKECCDCGAGGTAEPGQLRLGVGLAGVQEFLVVEGLLEGVGVFFYLQPTAAGLATDLDEGRIGLMSLINMELVPHHPNVR